MLGTCVLSSCLNDEGGSFSWTVTMNSPPKMASTVTTLGTKCSRPWAGKREKASVATSRASPHRLRYKWKTRPLVSGCVQRPTAWTTVYRVCHFPPQAQLRTKGAGLGTKGTNYTLSASDTYKDAVRKAMFARFTELEWDVGLELKWFVVITGRWLAPLHLH